MSHLSLVCTSECTFWLLILFGLTSLLMVQPGHTFLQQDQKIKGQHITLPPPFLRGNISLESSLANRRSTRNFSQAPLSLAEVSQLLWAAQGMTDQGESRTAPSAGALYPLEIYLVGGRVTGLAPAIYHYLPHSHSLELKVGGDQRTQLAEAALSQSAVRDGTACLVITAVVERTRTRYGARAERYVLMESGHAAQNVYLQAYTLGLGTVAVGAFEDDRIRRLMGLDGEEIPLYLLPVGKLRETNSKGKNL